VLGRPAPLRTDAGSTQYLRTLAAEAGIPVHLMSSDAWRSMIVGMVTDIERFGVACPDALARSLARGRSTGMPLAFRHEEFWQVLVVFARELAEIRAILPADLGPGGLEPWLDAYRPGWREGLSLRLDEVAVRALLLEAATARAAPYLGGTQYADYSSERASRAGRGGLPCRRARSQHEPCRIRAKVFTACGWSHPGRWPQRRHICSSHWDVRSRAATGRPAASVDPALRLCTSRWSMRRSSWQWPRA
jgi:hypothetical protein